jgi:hypothetical protein
MMTVPPKEPYLRGLTHPDLDSDVDFDPGLDPEWDINYPLVIVNKHSNIL